MKNWLLTAHADVGDVSAQVFLPSATGLIDYHGACTPGLIRLYYCEFAIFTSTLARRIVHAILYEVGALLILIPAASIVIGASMLQFGALMLILSVCAMLCNMLYQHGFEWIEKRFVLQRTLAVRMVHTAGFEIFFTAVALPLTAWWLQMSWLEAFLLDLTLTVFFLFYTFCYNWLYDLVRQKLRS
jgi:uncharacterized membrane protein